MEKGKLYCLHFLATYNVRTDIARRPSKVSYVLFFRKHIITRDRKKKLVPFRLGITFPTLTSRSRNGIGRGTIRVVASTLGPRPTSTRPSESPASTSTQDSPAITTLTITPTRSIRLTRNSATRRRLTRLTKEEAWL